MGKWTDIAIWEGNSPNHSSRNGTAVKGFVVHTAGGNGDGVVSWIMNSASDISSTFVVMKNGTIYQTLDTSLKPWTTGNSNSWTISAECEGFFGEPFTAAQIQSLAKILKKANQVYGVDIKHSKSEGISGHRQHMSTECPGDKRYAQLDEIVAAAKGGAIEIDGGIMLPKYGDQNTAVGYWQRMLNAVGYKLVIDNDYGPKTKAAVAAWVKAVSETVFDGEEITSWIAINLQRAVFAGAQGPKGDRGPAGPAGPKGDKGAPGDISGTFSLTRVA